MTRSLVRLGDGGGGQAQGGDAGAGTGPHRQVTGRRQWIGRQGSEVQVATPAGEESPLGGVDAPSVVGEDGLQGGGDQGTICRLSGAVVMDDSGGGGFGGQKMRDNGLSCI